MVAAVPLPDYYGGGGLSLVNIIILVLLGRI